MRSHEWIDERSLALDRQAAAKLRADPSLLVRARTTPDRLDLARSRFRGVQTGL